MSEHSAPPVIRAGALPPARWRNGGGVTREILARESEGDGGFDWRLSLAVIEESGRFSGFPGTERILTVVEGDSVALTVDGHVHQVAHGTPFRFSGDASVRATLPQGPVQVLNVITRPAAISASVVIDRLAPDRPLPVRPGQYVVLLSGRATLTAGGAEHGVGVHDTVHCSGKGDASLAGEGLVAVVLLQPGSAA